MSQAAKEATAAMQIQQPEEALPQTELDEAQTKGQDINMLTDRLAAFESFEGSKAQG